MRDHLAVRHVAGMRTVACGDQDCVAGTLDGETKTHSGGYDWRGKKAERRRRFEAHTKQKWAEYHSDWAKRQRIKAGFIRWGENNTDDCDTGWDALSWFEIVQEETGQKFPIVHCIAWLKRNGIVPLYHKDLSNEKHHEIVAAVNMFDETSLRGRYDLLWRPNDLEKLVHPDHSAVREAISHLQYALVLADV